MPNDSSSYCSCPPSYCKWDVSLILDPQVIPIHRYAVLILNRPLTQCETFLVNFWNNALLRMTVDGGTKQWDMFLKKLKPDVKNSMKLPDLVSGDFDSITETIFEKYKQKGCKIIHTPDQDHTDFTKALKEMQSFCKDTNIELDHVIAFGQSSGRLDQILANIQTLYLARAKQLLKPQVNVFLVSDNSLSWLLVPGEHVIRIPKETRQNKKAWCSLVPIGQTCERVTTTGLKWNLDEKSLRFGDLVSTSNAFAGPEEVKVKCSHTILWTMMIPSISG